tara:strand:+ start:1416 stop:1802 length:387 start_codon:yes stop_codon:yes gene_type:complete
MNINDFKTLVNNEDKNTIAVDFDGVIHTSSKGFYDGTIYDVPIDNTRAGLEYLSKNYKIIIYTCKANPNRPLVNGKTGIELIWEWLKKYNYDKYISDIVYEKPNAKYYIDDKAVRFRNWKQILMLLEK